MTIDDFIHLLQRLQAEPDISVGEYIGMENPDGTPVMDEYGGQMIRDVVQVGDGRLYIERDDNDEVAEQDIIDLLANIYNFLPQIIAGLQAKS